MNERMSERFVDLIQRKRDGGRLAPHEIRDMIGRYTGGQIPDYQMSAMLMAICFQGMDDEELTALTMAMRDSGDMVDLSPLPGVKVDKHSTGGVGDKTTLIVAPIVAACGVPVAKMSGRGLGFTGGTIDKLESIPGFRTDLTREEFFRAVEKNGLCVTGQSGELAPADKMLYALRDVTATVSSIPLIAASIMSKKLAAGSDKILLEVTTGSGALIQDPEGSRELARRMCAIGRGAGKETVAMITSMDEPLGYAIGNNLEVIEAIEVLRGGGPEDVKEVCLALAGMMIALGQDGAAPTGNSYEYDVKEYNSFENDLFLKGKERAREALESGAAFEKFKAMAAAQGGDVSYIEDTEKFEKAAVSGELTAEKSGYLSRFDTAGIGVAASLLGAGRETKDSAIDFSAGIRLKKKQGERVEQGEAIAVLYTSGQSKLAQALEHMRGCVEISEQKPAPIQLIQDIIR